MRELWRGRVLLIILAGAALFLIIYAWQIVEIFFAAAVLAYLLDPLVRFFEKKGCPRIWGIMVIYILLLILLISIGMWALPAFNREIAALAEALPGYLAKLETLMVQGQEFYQKMDLPKEVDEILANWLSGAESKARIYAARVLNGIIPKIAGSFVWLLVPIVSFYFLKDKKIWQGYVRRVLPIRRQKEERAFFRELDTVVMSFLRGSVVVGGIVGVLTALGLWIAGVNFALIFGFIAGVCNIVPYFGPLIGAAPAVVAAFLQEPIKAVWAAVVMTIVQQCESHFITPQIMSGKLGLNPIAIMFALLAFGRICGFWGVVLAVPLAGMLKVVVKYLISKAIYTRV